MHDEVTPRLRLAIDAAREGGAAALMHFARSSFHVEHKPDGTPVTNADRQCEELIRTRIRASFPHDAILGEEEGESPGTSCFRWIIDPIDGTKAFIRGVPLWGTLVGVVRGDRAVVGVVDLPPLRESVHAALGQGAWRRCGDGPVLPARVSGVGRLDEGLACFSAVETYHETGQTEVLARLGRASRECRGWSDIYAHYLVAIGRAEAAIEPRVSVWDVAPLQIILTEAGGRFSDWQGEDSIWTGTCISSNARVHDEVLGLLTEG